MATAQEPEAPTFPNRCSAAVVDALEGGGRAREHWCHGQLGFILALPIIPQKK